MHPLLERQIKKLLGSLNITGLPKPWQELLLAVSQAYQNFEEDRSLAQRSLDISSKELTESNQKLRQEMENAKKKAQTLEKMNNLMVGRELKMAGLKKEIAKLKTDQHFAI